MNYCSLKISLISTILVLTAATVALVMPDRHLDRESLWGVSSWPVPLTCSWHYILAYVCA